MSTVWITTIVSSVTGIVCAILGICFGPWVSHKFSKSRAKTQNEQKQIKELQRENTLLKDKIAKLEDLEAIEQRIIPINNTMFRLEDDKNRVIYCYVCWGKDKKKIPAKSNGEFYSCDICKNFADINQNAYLYEEAYEGYIA